MPNKTLDAHPEGMHNAAGGGQSVEAKPKRRLKIVPWTDHCPICHSLKPGGRRWCNDCTHEIEDLQNLTWQLLRQAHYRASLRLKWLEAAMKEDLGSLL